MQPNKASLKNTFLLIFAVISCVKAGFKVFSEGKMKIYNKIELSPEEANTFPDLGSNPIQEYQIKGVFRDDYKEYENDEKVLFEVSYSKASDPKGFKNALRLQFSAPFNLTEDYQGKDLVYSFDNQDPKYSLKNH